MPVTRRLRRGEAKHLRAIALMGVAAGLAFPSVAQAATPVEAETMTLSPSGSGGLTTDANASGGKALYMWSNGTASRSFSTAEASRRVVVRARGTQCNGAPQVSVTIDGTRVLAAAVSATNYTEYAADISVPAGAHTLKVTYPNDYRAACDRNLIVDSVTLHGAASGFEAESMSLPSANGTVANDSTASAGKSLMIWSNGAATRQQSTSAGTVVVRARGAQCQGAPRMRVTVDGQEVLNTEVSSTVWTNYTATAGTTTGTHSYAVAFTNDHGATGCNRDLYVDKLTIANVAPAPTPTPEPTPTPTPTTSPPTATSPTGTTFAEECDGTSVDSSKWITEWGPYFGVADFMRSTQHIRVQNGLCSISAVRQQSPNGLPWQSGLMSTRTKFGQMYGRFEMRAKLPKGMGLWPAFWLLPEEGRDGPPEIDIMEQYSNPLGTKPVDAGATSGTVHYGTNYSTDHGQHGVWHYASDYTLDWHTYAAEWRSDRVVFYVDGVEIGRVTQNIPKIRMYLIVNLALGASWAGMPDSSTPSPSTMDIDYIRAWA